MADKKDKINEATAFDSLEENEYENYDTEKKSGGFFSRLKKKKKGDDDDGYDIFDLDDPFEEERAKRYEKMAVEEDARRKRQEKEEKKQRTQRINERRQRSAQMNERRVVRRERIAKREAEEIAAEAGQQDMPEVIENTSHYSVDEINRLLASVGLTPLGSEDSDEIEKTDSFVINEEVYSADGQAYSADDDKHEPEEIISETMNEPTVENEMPAEKSSEPDTVDEVPETETKVIDNSVLKSKPADEQPLFDAETEQEDSDAETKKTDGSQSDTKLFNLSKILKKEFGSQKNAKGKKKKRFIDNFRVLENAVQDKPILERQPVYNAERSNAAENIDADGCDDIFKAVEENERFNTVEIQSIAQKKVAKEKRSAAAETLKKIEKNRKKEKTNIIVLAVLTILSCALIFFVSSVDENGNPAVAWKVTPLAFSILNLIVFVLGYYLNRDVLVRAFKSIRRLEINSAVCSVLIAVFALIELVVTMVTGTGTTLFVPFAMFSLMCEKGANYVANTSLYRNLSYLVGAKELRGLQPIDNETDADFLGYGISGKKNPVIYYSADVAIPSEPEKVAQRRSTSEPFYAAVGLAVFVLSLAASIALIFLEKNTVPFAACFVGAICVCFPSLKRLIDELLLRNCTDISNKNGAGILSFDSCVKFGESNAFIVDSDKLFKAGVSKFRAVPGGGVTQSDCVVFTAAVLKNTKSLLRTSFDDFLEEAGIDLPEAEEVIYEEGLGYSAWIAERRVLVGNRQMLVNHNIDCPSEEEENNYAKGRKVLYLVVEGKIAATFVVSYNEIKSARNGVSQFGKTGLVLMINSADPFITEQDVSMKLGIAPYLIKIVTSKGSEMVAAYQKPTVKRYDNGLLLSKKKSNELSAVSCIHSLYSAQKLSTMIYTIGCVVSLAVFTALAAIGINGVVTPMCAIILQAIWTAAAYLAGKTRFGSVK